MPRDMKSRLMDRKTSGLEIKLQPEQLMKNGANSLTISPHCPRLTHIAGRKPGAQQANLPDLNIPATIKLLLMLPKRKLKKKPRKKLQKSKKKQEL